MDDIFERTSIFALIRSILFKKKNNKKIIKYKNKKTLKQK